MHALGCTWSSRGPFYTTMSKNWSLGLSLSLCAQIENSIAITKLRALLVKGNGRPSMQKNWWRNATLSMGDGITHFILGHGVVPGPVAEGFRVAFWHRVLGKHQNWPTQFTGHSNWGQTEFLHSWPCFVLFPHNITLKLRAANPISLSQCRDVLESPNFGNGIGWTL